MSLNKARYSLTLSSLIIVFALVGCSGQEGGFAPAFEYAPPAPPVSGNGPPPTPGSTLGFSQGGYLKKLTANSYETSLSLASQTDLVKGTTSGGYKIQLNIIGGTSQ